MKILKFWPYAVLLGLTAFSFYLLGPFISGMLMFVSAIAVLTNLLSPRWWMGRIGAFFGWA